MTQELKYKNTIIMARLVTTLCNLFPPEESNFRNKIVYTEDWNKGYIPKYWSFTKKGLVSKCVKKKNHDIV